MTDDRAAFARLVEALELWLREIVFVGGWAHRLFRLHPLAKRVQYPPLMTHDADVAIPLHIKKARQDVRTRLRTAGFKEEFFGEERPPVTYYRLGGEQSGFYAEFLTPLAGGSHRRDGSPDATTSISGVTAQKLRHLDLLLLNPWTVQLPGAAGYPIGEKSVAIQVPTVVSYLVQKLLVLPRRKPQDRGKDLLYIHDAIELFGSAFEELRTTYLDVVRPALHRNRLKELKEAAAHAFVVSSDTAAEAVVIARSQGRSLTVSELCDLCAYGFDRIFSDH